MQLDRLHIQQFRNLGFVSLDTGQPAVFFLGANGQGKTNLLEAIGLMTALRSFRTSDTKAMIQTGVSEARLRFELTHEHEDAADVTLVLGPQGKTAFREGNRVAKLADLIGCFPTVALCADDILLLRGSPGLRRRFLDMTLSIDNTYLNALTRYHRALKQRNALFKGGQPDPALLFAFEREMAPAAADVVSARIQGVAELSIELKATYAAIATHDEQPDLAYAGDSAARTAEEFLQLWAHDRARDLQARATRNGPHRDDLELRLKGMPAREYASEGQQRALVLALKLAQAAFFYRRSGVRPIILADDILGQLDPERQQRFWNALGQAHQVFATGTSIPPAPPTATWHIFKVAQGAVALA